MFLVNTKIKSPYLSRLSLNLLKQDELALLLVAKDKKYVPDIKYQNALKASIKKGNSKSSGYRSSISIGWQITITAMILMEFACY